MISTRENITAPGWLNHYNNTANVKATKLTSTKKMGPNAFFKVMAGDKLVMSTDYYYTTGGSNTSGNVTNAIVSALISALTGSSAATGGVKDAGTQIGTQLTAPGPFSTFLENPANVTNTPNANLVYLFFDENFNPIMYDVATGLSSGAKPVGVVGTEPEDPKIQPFTATVPSNGYAFVYVNNNSGIDVWFDNFVVSHQRGRILQENHYYPYGLQIAAISSKAAGKMDNMYRYQGAYSEFEEETGWNDFELRTYDAQIGRWTGVDPYDQFASPYLGMGNYPVGSTDPDGGASGVDNFIVAAGHVKHSFSLFNAAFKIIERLGPVLYNYVNEYGHTFQSPNPQNNTGSVVFNDQVYKYTGTSQDVYKDLVEEDNFADVVQMGLDGVGMTEIPIVSQAAELISAGISFGRGDYTGAAIGLGSMIPIGGKLFEGMKIARRAAKVGREAHEALRSKVLLKQLKNPGWKSEVTKIGKNGKIYRLDVVTPSGKFIELKPNTISGRIKGWYQSNVYKKQLGIPGRVIYYNPANPFW